MYGNKVKIRLFYERFNFKTIYETLFNDLYDVSKANIPAMYAFQARFFQPVRAITR